MVLKRLRLAAALGACVCAGAAAAATHHHPAAGAPNKAPPTIAEYAVRAESGDTLKLTPPVLPDLDRFTSDAVARMIPQGPRGHVAVKRMVEIETLHEFVGGPAGRLAESAARQSTNPRAILIEGGLMTPRDLARSLPHEQFEETSPGVFVLRMPLVVAQGATLHIDSSTKEFRLSQDGGAFISNDGLMFITGSRFTGWNERAKRPSTFHDPREFRPFLVSFGGSKLYISDSVVSSLGYSESKAYGISISQYSPNMDARLHRPRPTGWILHSTFVDNWFGFYCYEADDVAVIGNTYRDNIYYGIDPHDRSRRLIIADNVVTGSREKHGVIVSREVDDSWIVRNHIEKNHLSGIVIDRDSTNNVVAYNDLVRNGTDGVTIYESSKNLLWGNRAIGNGRHGFRMRNSVDIRLYDNIAFGNRLAGIYGHIKDLTGTDRNLKLDPYELSSSMVVVGGQLVFNGSGPVTLDRPLSAELYNVELLAPSKSAGIRMTGILGRYQSEILDIMVRQGAAAVIEPADKPRKPQQTGT